MGHVNFDEFMHIELNEDLVFFTCTMCVLMLWFCMYICDACYSQSFYWVQSVINEADLYRNWIFMHTTNKRQEGSLAMVAYEKSVGKQLLMDLSLANLLISAECDYFVGTLGSNWNRLINELRLTNGRFKAGYITLNLKEW